MNQSNKLWNEMKWFLGLSEWNKANISFFFWIYEINLKIQEKCEWEKWKTWDYWEIMESFEVFRYEKISYNFNFEKWNEI